MMQVGEVARSLGLNPQTIYFYERIGLIPSPQRSEAGYRLFAVSDVERLAFIARAKALGLTLEEIKEILQLQDGHPLPCQDILIRLRQKVEQIEATMSQLQALQGELLSLVHLCENNLRQHGPQSKCIVFGD
jgi:DNA-binding transcriptional MerR regulator